MTCIYKIRGIVRTAKNRPSHHKSRGQVQECTARNERKKEGKNAERATVNDSADPRRQEQRVHTRSSVLMCDLLIKLGMEEPRRWRGGEGRRSLGPHAYPYQHQY